MDAYIYNPGVRFTHHVLDFKNFNGVVAVFPCIINDKIGESKTHYHKSRHEFNNNATMLNLLTIYSNKALPRKIVNISKMYVKL